MLLLIARNIKSLSYFKFDGLFQIRVNTISHTPHIPLCTSLGLSLCYLHVLFEIIILYRNVLFSFSGSTDTCEEVSLMIY